MAEVNTLACIESNSYSVLNSYAKNEVRVQRRMIGQFSRRQFLNAVGKAGGSAAVYQSALALGLISNTQATRAALKPVTGSRKKVIILGAGLAGLTSAYELERAGYECTILEASHRIGGRNLTIRGGDTVDELGYPQKCNFDNDKDLYFNAGPSRIPIHHHHLMHYLRTFQVPLEVFTNNNRNAWVHDTNAFGGKRMRIKQYAADARGFMAELSSKSLNRKDFDKKFTDDDFERFQAFLKSYGDLNENALYKGSSRAGYQSGGMISPAIKKTPADFREILKSSFWDYNMHWAQSEDQSAPMLTATGGMDAIVNGFVDNLKSKVLLNAQVQNVQLHEHSVSVAYRHKGKLEQISGDYCFNSIPKHIMSGIENNFPHDYQTALSSIPRGLLFKMGIQMNERFWEKEDIYGGFSWTNQDIEQLWYPPHGTFGKKGIMIVYMFSEEATYRFGLLNPKQRIEKALREAEAIHPDIRKYVDSAVSVPWHRMNHIMGCTAAWTPELRDRWFARLQEPVGRHYLIGDQISYHPGWQEGAFGSAHFALSHLNARQHKEIDDKPSGIAQERGV